MARSSFMINKLRRSQLTIDRITDWFVSNDFQRLEFENGQFEIVTHVVATRPIYYNIKENSGYTSYAKQAYGGSILVFEINSTPDKIDCQCYAPMLLFGIIRLELNFKEKASWITKYRREGYKHMVNLKEFITNNLG